MLYTWHLPKLTDIKWPVWWPVRATCLTELSCALEWGSVSECDLPIGSGWGGGGVETGAGTASLLTLGRKLIPPTECGAYVTHSLWLWGHPVGLRMQTCRKGSVFSLHADLEWDLSDKNCENRWFEVLVHKIVQLQWCRHPWGCSVCSKPAYVIRSTCLIILLSFNMHFILWTMFKSRSASEDIFMWNNSSIEQKKNNLKHHRLGPDDPFLEEINWHNELFHLVIWPL